MASVVLQHVTKRYGNVEAVHDVNLDIRDQEFLVFLGPSGCGKTTTLRMVAGLEELSGGDIFIGDENVSQKPPKDRDIAMVFQNYALYPHMTVYENMAFGLKLRKTPKSEIDRRVKEAAEILGLGQLLSRKPKELSGGQRQRVALGRAIVREPKAFLMDEPLSNLDAKLRTQTRVELKNLHRRLGATIIYVTHDQTEAMTMGTRIVVMRDGVVQQVDTPDGIYNNPANQFVATFVGTPAMNLVKGAVISQGDTASLQIGSQTIELPGRIRQTLSRLNSNALTLGVRPEDIFLGEGRADEPALNATVQVIEPMGHEHIVYLAVEGQPIVARTDNAWQGRVGDVVRMKLNPQRLHAFDPQTEASLLYS
ncbi:MAG: sn-glycerol-3-phosphate ABC transporter ATP-binding protein UgpC [Sulfobacillus thermotolerans]|uniref:Glycerol-3-phosphate ABC transporter ATP-binding protein n=1 Tax=Sulfobacillus thermotolerans TaxID=338644 RepID=A0ABM6RQP1_9FIRM|nr:glycerol-3-phosphate ABC transporter ATP-binding protein [Sulfobacillus thermotolerans]MCY0907075.1 sn-glycerol-3-phosphate ABC transporter ATP-binding protein UgpC [Sulfobacillus thermotolerans]